MSFKQEFQSALAAGADYQVLMDLVRHHRAAGLSVDAAYAALHELWLEHGFNETANAALQDTLEAVMEKVWYGQPVI
jgi:hypothetical protein